MPIGAEATLLSYTVMRRLERLNIENYAAYSKLAILIYEVSINLDREVQFVWKTCGSFQWSNVLYFINRYPLVLYEIWSIYYTPNTTPSCDTIYQLLWYFGILTTHIAIIVTWILCVYAIYRRSLPSLGAFILGMATIASDIYQGIDSSCSRNTSLSETLWVSILVSDTPINYSSSSGVLTYILLSVFDLLATSLIMTKLIRKSNGLRKLKTRNLLEFVLESGALYFCAVTIPQLIAVALYFAPDGLYSPLVNNFLIELSSVMTARFLLGLRETRKLSSQPESSLEESIVPLSILTFDITSNWSRSWDIAEY
ncbi:hypothetical protein D9757_008333 [Collybiopsis confluens]|uniref:DUF6533 domain-containing protein n=1 Tax=Collybiopsis confluens TaxID=2823264 RepID=A0A8H5HEM5_9AGAR|nr:hypothetical protein D9757_008333 [Collybiopsis confluens]